MFFFFFFFKKKKYTFLKIKKYKRDKKVPYLSFNKKIKIKNYKNE